jgi:hypothetical protein
MNADLIKTWLEKDKSRRKFEKFIEAGFSFIVGVIVLVLTFALTYFVMHIATNGFFSVAELVSGVKWQLATGWFYVISAVFMVLLFVQYLRMESWGWGRYAPKKKDTGTLMQREFEENVKNIADAISPNSQAPTYADVIKNSGMASKAIADVLVTGPRLFLGSFKQLKELFQINGLQVNQCAAALAFIYERSGEVSYEEFCQGDRGEQIKQLRNIEGVSFLKDKLYLRNELMAELKGLN